MNLADNRRLRLVMLCAMYVAQGIPWGFTAITLPAYLVDHGVTVDAVGVIMATTTGPYAFKWVWGFVIDAFQSKRFGRRRPWIIGAELMMGLTILSMAFVGDLTSSTTLIARTVFVHTIFNSMQDVAVDALAVDLLEENERGRANGLMYASKWGGGMLGGWGISHLIALANLRVALFVQAIVLFAIMLIPLFVQERAVEAQPRPDLARAIVRWSKENLRRDVVISALRDRAIWSAVLVALVMLISNAAAALLAAVGNGLFVEQLHWSAEDYAGMIGGPGLALGAVGSVIGGFVADRIGHRLMAGIAALCLTGYYVAFSQLSDHWTSTSFVYSVFWVEPFFLGMMTASLFALCMDVTWKAIAASQFAIYMALSSLSATLAYAHAGDAVARYTYPGIYQLAAWIQLSLVVVLPFVRPKK
ncbi:MAG: MFS transporter [Kofleriaceae bacterium]